MLQKIVVPILFAICYFLFLTYGYISGKAPDKGSFFGLHYDSPFARAVISPIQFIWILIIANALFSLAYHFGFISYKNFLVITIIAMAANIIALLFFNLFIAKESFDWPIVIGLIFVALGSIAAVAHKEIAQMF